MTDSLPKDVAFVNPRAEHDFKGRTCSIVGVGSYVPERRLTNADLEEMVETTDEWITTRTGIKERRIASDDQFTSDLATEAARKAMSKAGVTGGDIDLVIVATITHVVFDEREQSEAAETGCSFLISSHLIW